MLYNNKIFICNAILLLLLVTLSSQIRAEAYFSTKIYPEEKAVFAFFRTAKSAPDFQKWIVNGERYKATPKNLRRTFLLKEKLRLDHGFGLYDVNSDLLELRLGVLVKYISATKKSAPRITFKILNVSSNDTPTFDYPYGNDYISLIIEKLLLFSDMPLTEKQNSAVIKKIPYENDIFDADLNISVRVKKANINDPIRIGKINQWIMLGEIAYLKCTVDKHYNGEEYTLWDYVAPWYEEEFRIKNMPEEKKYPHPYDLFKDK